MHRLLVQYSTAIYSRAMRMRDAFQEIYKALTIDDFTHALNEGAVV